MKNRKLKTILLVAGIGVCVLGGSIMVSASKAKEESEHPVKSILIDPYGNKIVTYEEDLYVDDADEEGVSVTSTAVPIDEDED